MPTYEYRCDACGHEFELFQKMSESPARDCPECGRPEVRRRISAGGGVLFKGPGFYATDYRKPAPSDSKKKPAGPKPGPDSHDSKGGTSDD